MESKSRPGLAGTFGFGDGETDPSRVLGKIFFRVSDFKGRGGGGWGWASTAEAKLNSEISADFLSSDFDGNGGGTGEGLEFFGIM